MEIVHNLGRKTKHMDNCMNTQIWQKTWWHMWSITLPPWDTWRDVECPHDGGHQPRGIGYSTRSTRRTHFIEPTNSGISTITSRFHFTHHSAVMVLEYYGVGIWKPTWNCKGLCFLMLTSDHVFYIYIYCMYIIINLAHICIPSIFLYLTWPILDTLLKINS